MKFHSLLLYWGSSIIFRNTSAAWNEALRPYINTEESLFFLMRAHKFIKTAAHFGELSVKTARYIYLHNLFFFLTLTSDYFLPLEHRFSLSVVVFCPPPLPPTPSPKLLWWTLFHDSPCHGQLPYCSPRSDAIGCTEGVHKPFITVFQPAHFWDGLPVCRSAWGPPLQFSESLMSREADHLKCGWTFCASEYHLF